jgi:hypothetical protein
MAANGIGFSVLVASAFVAAAATLKFDAPQGWVSKAPGSSMRVAEFTLPKTAGDSEDATLAVFHFGGQGGTIEANLERWIGQMTQPDGRASKDVARTTKLSPRGLPITLVDLTGTYVAEVSPGSSERFNKPGFRLRAAVVETKEGPYFVKLTGPEKTVGRWDEAFMSFLKSLRIEP